MIYIRFIVTLVFFAGVSLLGQHAEAATITVDTIIVDGGDDGSCGIDEAIQNADDNSQAYTSPGECSSGEAGIDTIEFNIAGTGPHIFDITETLFTSEPVIIDGTTQPGTVCGDRPDLGPTTRQLMIEFDMSGFVGSGPEDTPPFLSLSETADGSTIKGLAIYGNPVAQNIRVDSSDNIFICNNIGTDSEGLVSKGGNIGIQFYDDIPKSNNRVGGLNPGDFNIISGNSLSGVAIGSQTEDTQIIGNFIGVDATGLAPLGSSDDSGGMVSISGASGTILGGSTEEARNYIGADSGTVFGLVGLLFTEGDEIMGNNIGVGIDGTTDVNELDTAGIAILSAIDFKVGGIISELGRNLIGNTTTGVFLGGDSTGSVLGNEMVNNDSGVQVLRVRDGFFSGLPEVVISQNSIDESGYGTIDLFEAADDDAFINGIFENVGPTINDPLDGDTGPNDYLNKPVLISGVQDGSDVLLTYMLDVPASTNSYKIEFFTNPSGLNSDGFGPLEVYEQSLVYNNANNEGVYVGTTLLADITLADNITATITSCDDVLCDTSLMTSEVSNGINENADTGIDVGATDDLETYLQEGGAYHILRTVALGESVLPDTLNSMDSGDNDGILFNQSRYYPGDSIEMTISATDSTYLNVFVDVNNDGDFSDSDEWVVNDELVDDGEILTLPLIFSVVGEYNIRFRYTSYDPNGGLSATGEALDGEVEDYVIRVVKRPLVQGVTSEARATNIARQVKTSQDNVKVPLNAGTCPTHLIVSDAMKQGDRDGNYSSYNKKKVTQVNILQSHINRILVAQYNQAAGPVDGIFGPLTKQGVMRLQAALNTILKPVPILTVDGIVGSFTRSAINNSCGN
jgi:peptidoglycan hydrolase-like protein with peptidoglycan-binding domain